MKFWRDFGQRHDLITNIPGTQEDIVNQKTALQTMDTPVQAVSKRQKLGPETRSGVVSQPPVVVQMIRVNNSVAFARWQQREAINLGSATHSS